MNVVVVVHALWVFFCWFRSLFVSVLLLLCCFLLRTSSFDEGWACLFI